MQFRRRTLLSGLGALMLSACSRAGTNDAEETRTGMTFVLVHGAWHGGWCWDLVRPILEAQGHTVLTPTLSGLGERADLLSAETDLHTHIADVIEVLSDVADEKIILVGHSYGGMVVTGVADRVPERIAHLVYLDAAVPDNGQSMLTVGAPQPDEAYASTEAALRALATEDGLAFSVLPPVLFGVPETHERYDWLAERLTPHPIRSWFDPITLSGGGAQISKTYVHCVAPVMERTSFPFYAERAGADPDWQYFELQTGHDAMVTAPEDVADILLRVTA